MSWDFAANCAHSFSSNTTYWAEAILCNNTLSVGDSNGVCHQQSQPFDLETNMRAAWSQFNISWGSGFDNPVTWAEADYSVYQHHTEKLYLFANSDNVVRFILEEVDDYYIMVEYPYGLYEDENVDSVSDWDMWYSSCPANSLQNFRSKLNSKLNRRKALGSRQTPTSNIDVTAAMTSLFRKLTTPSARPVVSMVQDRASISSNLQSLANQLGKSPLSFKTDAQIRQEVNEFMFYLDTNQDSFVSRAEMDALKQLSGGLMDDNMLNMMFTFMDTNRD